jgi:hypothetical protein
MACSAARPLLFLLEPREVYFHQPLRQTDLDFPALFWIGVALAAANLLMNGLFLYDELPGSTLIFSAAGAWLLTRWNFRAGTGLPVWTAIEAAGEFLIRGPAPNVAVLDWAA